MYQRGWRHLNQREEVRGIKSWPILNLFFKKHQRKLVLRDYQPKTFLNPFYSQVSQLRRTRALRLKLTVLFLALLGNLGVFLKHPFFNITEINIQGAEKISVEHLRYLANNELSKTRAMFLTQRNYWLVETTSIIQTIKNNYSLNKLEINTKFPRTLNIILKEKEAALAYKTEAKTWLLDDQGRVIQNLLGATVPASLPVVYENSSTDILKINTALVPPATVKFLSFLQTKIPEAAKVEVDYSRLIDKEGRVVHLKTKEKWEIYLDRQNDWDKQVGVLTTILNTKLKSGREKIRYIDVRYENRAYFQ